MMKFQLARQIRTIPVPVAKHVMQECHPPIRTHFWLLSGKWIFFFNAAH